MNYDDVFFVIILIYSKFIGCWICRYYLGIKIGRSDNFIKEMKKDRK